MLLGIFRKIFFFGPKEYFGGNTEQQEICPISNGLLIKA
jgi:hypothetical protein